MSITETRMNPSQFGKRKLTGISESSERNHSYRYFLIAAEVAIFLPILVFVIYVNEIDYNHRLISFYSVALLICLLFAATGGLRKSLALSVLIVAVIGAISWIKVQYMGIPFVLNDLFYLTGSNLKTTLSQYSHLIVLGGLATLCILALAALICIRKESRVHWRARILAVLLAPFLAWNCLAAIAPTQLTYPKFSDMQGSLSMFVKSAVDSTVYGGQAVIFSGVGATGLGDFIEQEAAAGVKPDIVMVHNESVFDPRIFNLPIQDNVAEYLAPQDSVNGQLQVNIHGGYSWLSEFSVMTGLDTEDFGQQAAYLPVLMPGKVKHSLLTHLKSLGYRTVVVYCVEGTFVNAEQHYRALGADYFIEDAKRDIDWSGRSLWTRDRQYYQRALDKIDSLKRTSDAPVFALIVTIYNHGPHGGAHGADKIREDAVSAWLDEMVEDKGYLSSYRDYYARLQHTIDDYRWLKDELTDRSDNRPAVLVNYGDHQPRFTKKIPMSGEEAHNKTPYLTAFSIEGINMMLNRVPDWGGDNLDVAYLPGMILAAAGLEADQLFQARQELMVRCRGRYTQCDDTLKGRIHRTLVDRGLLNVDGVVGEQPVPAT